MKGQPKNFTEASTEKPIVSNRVAEFRRSIGISLTCLAERISISRQTLYNIETGRVTPTLLMALKLAQYFDTSVDQLFTLETEFDFFESVRVFNRRVRARTHTLS